MGFIFLANDFFCCGSPMNSQDELVYAPDAVKQHNMHKIRASRISSLVRHGLNASTAM